MMNYHARFPVRILAKSRFVKMPQALDWASNLRCGNTGAGPRSLYSSKTRVVVSFSLHARLLLPGGRINLSNLCSGYSNFSFAIVQDHPVCATLKSKFQGDLRRLFPRNVTEMNSRSDGNQSEIRNARCRRGEIWTHLWHIRLIGLEIVYF